MTPVVHAAIEHAKGYLNEGRTVIATDRSLVPRGEAASEPRTPEDLARLKEIATVVGSELGRQADLLKCEEPVRETCRLVGAENLLWFEMPEIEGRRATILVGWRRRIQVVGSEREAVTIRRQILELEQNEHGSWKVARILYDIR